MRFMTLIQKGGIIIFHNIPWAEFENKMYATFGKKFKYVDELHYNVNRQIQFGEETELTDAEALAYLQELHFMSGMLYVITDYCYEKKCGPFIVAADRINEFVEGFYSHFGEAFYSTDIIVISFAEKLIWVLFHEGICWLSKG